MSSNLTRWEIRERTVVRTREETGPLRPQRSPTGPSPSRGSLTPTADDSRPSPTFLLEGRSIGRPATPSSSKSPSPQILHPDCRPTVKFTVEEDREWNGGGGVGGEGAEGSEPSPEGGKVGEDGAPINTRAKQIFMSHQPPPLPLPTTPPPYQPPAGTTPPPVPPPDGRSLGEPEGDDDEDDEEDYSASVSAILQQRRQASTRRSRRRSRRTSSPFSPLSPDGASLAARHDRRRSSVFTTSSADTGFSVAVAEDARVIGGTLEGDTAIAEGAAEAASPTAVAAATQQQIFENLRLHKEVRESVRLQPWPMRRKVRLVQRAKAYVRRHEGELQERLAHGKTTRDLLARANLLIVKHWQHLKRELVNAAGFLIPWEHRIKEIESHFGSVVASYFTFLRWLFWVNLVIATLLIAFVIIPELLVGREHGGWDDRKEMLPEEKAIATNLLTLWDFEGALKYSPMFYGFYSSREKTDGGYRIPFAYFMTGLAVYVYSFVATLRKMAENSRMSKLSEKDDECVFSWKLFTGWDYMIGNAETAHNRVASIILGFKEVLLEEREKQKDRRNWKVIGLRVLVNILVLFLLATSAYAVVLVVRRSTKATAEDSWWRQNEITVVLSLISVAFPVLFELIGFLESYHPRKQLRIQLARIMVLNLLNLYTLIFALFGKISNMTRELQELKPNNVNSTPILYNGEGNVSSSPTLQVNSTYINISSSLFTQKDDVTTAMTTSDVAEMSGHANPSLFLSISPQCFKELVRCIVDATTLQNSSHISTEKEMISVLVNMTATLIPLFLEIFLHSNLTQTFFSPETSSTPTFPPTVSPWLDGGKSTQTWSDDLKKITSSLATTATFSQATQDNYSQEITKESFTDTPITDYSKSLALAEFYTSSDQPMANDTDLPFTGTTESLIFNTDDLPTTMLDALTTITYDLPTTITTDPPITSNMTEENDTYSQGVSSEDNSTENWMSLFQDDDARFNSNGSTTQESELTETSIEPMDTGQTMGTLSNDSLISLIYEESDNASITSTTALSTNEPLTTKPLITESTIAESSTEHSTINQHTTKLLTTVLSVESKRENLLSKLDEAEVTKKDDDYYYLTADSYDIAVPLSLIRQNNTKDFKRDLISHGPADPTSVRPDLERKNDLISETKNLEMMKVSTESGPLLTSTEEFAKRGLKHTPRTNARSFLIGHIVTIILTAAILVSKEEDSKLITEKLFKKDENKISELIAAWKQSLQEEQQMNGTKEKMGEQCFTMHCKESTEEGISPNISDLKHPQQNCTTSTCSSEETPTSTIGYVFSSRQMDDESERSSTEMTGYTTTPKSYETLSYHSKLDTRRKLRRLCWETMFGQELVKLTVMDLVLTIASTFLVDFVRALFVRIMNHCWCWDLEKQFPQYGDFKIAENILHLVYNQGMVWMGMFFSPGLPALNLAKLAVVLYVRSWVVLTCNVPHDVVFRASRSNNFYLALLLTMLFLCALPVGYALVWVEPSWHCGPFAGKDRISSLFTSSVRSAFPDSLRPVLDYVASPALIIPLLVLLILVVAYLLALAAALREANDDLRIQLRRERTEERRKMFRIANGRGRRGRRARGGMPRDCRAASDDASAMGVMDDFVEGDVPDGEVVAAAPVKEAEGDAAVQGASGWRSLLGRIANLRVATSKSTSHNEKTEKSAGSPLKGSKTPDNASKGNEGAEACGSQHTQRTPSVETTRRQIRCLDEIEDGMLPHKSSSSSRGDRDSPSSTCWSGDIPLIRIVRTADEGNRTPQQAQPQQPTGSYDNAALDQTSELNQQENIKLTDK